MQDYKQIINTEKDLLIKIIKDIVSKAYDQESLLRVLQKNPSKKYGVLSKSTVLIAYDTFSKNSDKFLSLSKDESQKFHNLIKMKNVRTISGVTPVTVLTKPFPCPGKCIFCPNDDNMPKSYLSKEPGAQRATQNHFDPYLQTFNRLVSYKNIGHSTDKIELIILGGTWSVYPSDYKIWFIKRCFDALNDFDSDLEDKSGVKTLKDIPYFQSEDNLRSQSIDWEDLFKSHSLNETSKSRCVGLVVETRPDVLTQEEVLFIRKLGATKVQIGIQSLNDKVLSLNQRGHNLETTKKAVNLLRLAGFKIHAHWMPNLYGSTPDMDKKDYEYLFGESNIKPDEIKIYPCSLIEGTKLMDYYKNGSWTPYNKDELLDVLTHCISHTPIYTRITRVVRDISSNDIYAGNKLTNFRQLAESCLIQKNIQVSEIRSREIRGNIVDIKDLKLKPTKYDTDVSQEVFLEYTDDNNRIAAFLRLSFPKTKNFIEELEGGSIIREVHVYGQSLGFGEKSEGKAQHLGLGKSLIEEACKLSKENGYSKVSVISSIGTREYYANNGFSKGNLYQNKIQRA